MENYEVFERIRVLKIQLAKLKDDYKHQTPTVKSPKMDGMPKAYSESDAGVAWVDKRNSLARRIRNMENEYNNKLKKANMMMEDMPYNLFRFCNLYFINAYDIDHTCIVLEFSRRTFYNRMKELHEYLKDAEETEKG